MAIYFDNSMVNVGGGSSEDLSAELAEYTALNTELEEVIDSLPDAGGTGGEVETGTLTLTYTGNAVGFGEYCTTTFYYTKLSYGLLECGELTESLDTIVVEDIVVGSILVCHINEDPMGYFGKTYQGVELVAQPSQGSSYDILVFRITDTDATITFS